MFTNSQSQALSNFGEASNLMDAIHALNFRSENHPQIKALLPIITPQLEARINELVELAITQWKIEREKKD